MIKTFPTSLILLPMMLDWIRPYLEEKIQSTKERMLCEVALEEALVNVILYAYPEGKGELNLKLEENEHFFILHITDSGKPFNPLEKQASLEAKNTLEDFPEVGGLGIPFIKQIMDEVHYLRKNNQNILTLKKKA